MTYVAVYIGDIVEVFCDHKHSGRRVRDWVEGVVVHADDRMTAIQFRNDVYLTDGWMVPDRILWFNKGSVKIRLAKKSRGSAVSQKSGASAAVRNHIPASRTRKPADTRRPVRRGKK
jgi:hypothetical protein